MAVPAPHGGLLASRPLLRKDGHHARPDAPTRAVSRLGGCPGVAAAHGGRTPVVPRALPLVCRAAHSGRGDGRLHGASLTPTPARAADAQRSKAPKSGNTPRGRVALS